MKSGKKHFEPIYLTISPFLSALGLLTNIENWNIYFITKVTQRRLVNEV